MDQRDSLRQRATPTVLIAGAGPTGLMLACELARRGVSFRLIEAAAGPQPGSRGKGLQPRTLEAFDDLGIGDRVIAHGRMAMPIRSTGLDGRVTLGGAAPEALKNRPDIPYTTSLITPEWRTEEALRLRLAELGGDEHQRARDADVLAHQIHEIERAALDDPDEDDVLVIEEERLSDLAAHRERAGAALAALDADGVGTGALDLLGAAAAALDGRAALAELDRRIRSAQAELSDVATDLRSVVETWDDDPQRLEAVLARRRQLTDLYRKYGGDRAAVIGFADDARERLKRLRHAEEEAGELEGERRAMEEELATAERTLLSARLDAAPVLAAAIEARLGDLAMAGARFAVEIEPAGAGEVVTFLLGANAGESVRPLAKAASGGELARTMLALRLVAPGGPSTMVFDEVDAGVGGTAALALARALHEVGRHRQVLVVTHLAQVAAFANRHLSVRKVEEAGRVTTAAEAVAGPERVVEISRMLSGHPDSRRAQAHAEELLDLARSEGATVAGR